MGERIGSFSAKGPHWRLAEKLMWNDTPPALDEGPRVSEDDDGWGLSMARRAGKGGAGRHHHGRAGAAGSGQSGTGAAGTGGRTPRSGQFNTAVKPQATCRRGFKELTAVDRLRPDLYIAELEKKNLANQLPRVEP